MKTIRVLAFLAAGSAFYLLIAGAQVNAHQAALSVPDWPLSYGGLLAPEWPGNVFYEQHHRAAAGSTLVLFALVSVALTRRRDLPTARRMSSYAAATLGLQTLLGGLIVLKLNPPWLGAIHVFVAITTVVLIVATALLIGGRSRPLNSQGSDRIRGKAKFILGLVALQLTLGALTRHPPIGELTFMSTLLAHLSNGVIVSILLILMGLSMVRASRTEKLRGWGWLLLASTIVQLALGAGLLVIAPEPLNETWPPPAGFPVVHAAHLLLAAVIATCLVAPLLRNGPAIGRRMNSAN
jgi:heme A synthase